MTCSSPESERGVLERLQQWLLTELADSLARPGNLKLVVHIDAERKDVKTVIERYQRI